MKNGISIKVRFLCALLTVSAVSLSACGAMTNDMAPMESFDQKTVVESGYAADYSYSTSFDSEKYYESDASDDAFVGDAPTSAADPTVSSDSARKLIKTVSMEMETKTFDAFLEELYDRIEMAGGYIQSSSVNGNGYSSRYGYSRSAYVTARIPADRLDFFCDGVAGAANVISRTEDTSDVTLKYYDTESHMKALQSEYETLVCILEKCTKLEDVISVQRRITEVLYQIESYKTTLNNYDNLVTYSTVTMRVEEVKEETIVTEQTLGERILSGVKSSLSDIREWAEDTLVGLVALSPYLLIWAVVICAIVLIVRGSIRRGQKKRALKRAQKAEQLQSAAETPDTKA